MPDNFTSLRDRIAALLELLRPVTPVEAADAVIRELNLATACQSGCVWQIPNHIEGMTDTQKQLLKRADDE